MTKVTDGAFGVDKLLTSAFNNNSGNVVKLLAEIFQVESEGITFLRFCCRIDPTHEYSRIKQEPFLFQFALRLPHQNFDAVTNKVEDISSPSNTKS